MRPLFFVTALLLPLVAGHTSCAEPARSRLHGCTDATATQRKEWGSMTNTERLAYINGIKCLMRKPSKFSHGLVPASTNLFVDFAAVHVNLTTSIHISGIFLSWHRHFLWLLEQALHQECHYPWHLGIPYWDWTKWPVLEESPMFNGNATSLGGNGVFDPAQGPYIVGPGQILPHGSGCGCVTTGPFANTTVTLGPFNFQLVYTGLPANWSQPNPHCMTRDLNDYGAATFDNATLLAAFYNPSSITDVQVQMNSKNPGTTDRGLHGGGHYAVGGVMTRPFFLHHGNIDRIWERWQAADPGRRRFQYNGTSTIFNTDATPEVGNCTTMSFGVLREPVGMHSVADPMAGRYCYKYV